MTRHEYAARIARTAQADAALARIERPACFHAAPVAVTSGARKGLCRLCGGRVTER